MTALEGYRRGSARSERGDWLIAAPRWWSLMIKPCALKLGIVVMLVLASLVSGRHVARRAAGGPEGERGRAARSALALDNWMRHGWTWVAPDETRIPIVSHSKLEIRH